MIEFGKSFSAEAKVELGEETKKFQQKDVFASGQTVNFTPI